FFLGCGGASAGSMESLCQLRDLKRATGLQALVNRPRITTGLSDQTGNANPFQLHCTARKTAPCSSGAAMTLPRGNLSTPVQADAAVQFAAVRSSSA
ncbi:hypothetical protein, partial [Mycobacterium sp. 1245801.1]|uniref:hypothetical protein n=1 Tax=Mycobacterium sp. 1245801.1 TaxID=1834075 RepID=UPI001E2E299D